MSKSAFGLRHEVVRRVTKDRITGSLLPINIREGVARAS
jgi:hypothetical protein